MILIGAVISVGTLVIVNVVGAGETVRRNESQCHWTVGDCALSWNVNNNNNNSSTTINALVILNRQFRRTNFIISKSRIIHFFLSNFREVRFVEFFVCYSEFLLESCCCSWNRTTEKGSFPAQAPWVTLSGTVVAERTKKSIDPEIWYFQDHLFILN